MAILSKRLMVDVAGISRRRHGASVRFMTLAGDTACGAADALAALDNTRRRRDYALQESINSGEAHFFYAAPGIGTWVCGLENRRVIHGGLVGGEVLVGSGEPARPAAVDYLVEHGMAVRAARSFVEGLPVWEEDALRASAAHVQQLFYEISGWRPELMRENRRRVLQQEQLTQAIEDRRKQEGERGGSLYAFEKERRLLANIRAGDRGGARRILNEMLAAIYMSSPRLVVLRARSIELLSCLTRAAIEDNPLMEPLIERNHGWTERLVRAEAFEELSEVLMRALDEFIDGIYMHGFNRSNTKVRQALDYIAANYARQISLRHVARAVGLSGCRLSHLVKQHTGRTVLRIVQETRVRHAQHLLERTSRSCTEIAYEVGFGDQSYFIKHFKRLTGTTPARFRRGGA